MLGPTVSLAVFGLLLAGVLWRGPRLVPGSEPVRGIAVASIVFVVTVGFGAWAVPTYGPGATGSWEVGELRPDGLRLVPTPPWDASRVLGPASLAYDGHRELYANVTRMPGLMNQLYCWCGCIKLGRHRSALGCFEDASAKGCGVCQETARIAWREVRSGVTDPARIQRAIDREWAPPEAR